MNPALDRTAYIITDKAAALHNPFQLQIFMPIHFYGNETLLSGKSAAMLIFPDCVRVVLHFNFLRQLPKHRQT